jgi:hypothetical protein
MCRLVETDEADHAADVVGPLRRLNTQVRSGSEEHGAEGLLDLNVELDLLTLRVGNVPRVGI